MSKQYRRCTTSNPFVNCRYDPIITVLAIIFSLIFAYLFIAWWMCII